MTTFKTLVAAFAVAFPLCSMGQTPNKSIVIDVAAGKTGAVVQPTMYGIFFEDINYAADGGLYAELVKNRSFEFPQHFMGWKTFGRVRLMADGPFNRNPHYARLAYAGHREMHTGLDNEGFFGIGLKAAASYRFSVWARTPEGGEGSLRIELINPASMGETQVLTAQNLVVTSTEWKKYTLTLQSPTTIDKAHLRLFLTSRATVDVEHVSLFPEDTWKGHENGLRRDLAQALADLHPGIFRFPGGCIVEGTHLADRYQWKNTVGPVENRPLNLNRWQYTFANRFYPDYYQSGGLGFYEYFLLSEEIGAQPLPILNCGLACEYQNPPAEGREQVALDSLDSYIQDALDLIEFANGPATSTWGKVRAQIGHPRPFNLKYIGIGNEQWGKVYVDRLEKFVKVLHARHPEIKIVGSAGPNPDGADFDYLWKEMRRLGVDLVDEHYYRPEKWFASNAGRYDNYSRKGPKVFAGEYACHGANGKKWNHFYASLMEATLMTGLERNADVVHMATYAPLFAHVEGWQWRPDLIWFDNLRSVRSCSYYVQQIFATNRGTNVVPVTSAGRNIEGQDSVYASGVKDSNSNEIIVKVVNIASTSRSVSLRFKGLTKTSATKAATIVYASKDLDKDNTLDSPSLYVPVHGKAALNGNTLNATVEPWSVNVFKIKQ